MAPEAFEGRYSVASDMWAAGALLYKLLVGTLPYPQGEFHAVLSAILGGALPRAAPGFRAGDSAPRGDARDRPRAGEPLCQRRGDGRRARRLEQALPKHGRRAGRASARRRAPHGRPAFAPGALISRGRGSHGGPGPAHAAPVPPAELSRSGPRSAGYRQGRSDVPLTDELRPVQIGHILTIDVVGFSAASLPAQGRMLAQLTAAVQATQAFRTARTATRCARSRPATEWPWSSSTTWPRPPRAPSRSPGRCGQPDVPPPSRFPYGWAFTAASCSPCWM